MNITITFSTTDLNFKLWGNNNIQNIYALFKLLNKNEKFNVNLVNLGIDISLIKSEPIISLKKLPFCKWDAIKDSTDLLIDCDGILNKEQINYLKSKNSKLVLYKIKNSYIDDLEDIVFENKKTMISKNSYDEIWILPHNQKTDEVYLKEIYNTNVYTLPYLWTHDFIKAYEKHFRENKKTLYYTPHKTNNITIFEPNSDITNTSIYPLIIANKVYKEIPELINKIYVINALQLNKNPRFLSIINNLELFKDKKLIFEYNVPTPYVLSEVTDVVISHQWGNELFNSFFDILYGKYPLLHNSEILKSYGFYYDGFNIDIASKKLISVLNNFSKLKENYSKNCEQLIYSYSTNNQANMNRYVERIINLIQ